MQTLWIWPLLFGAATTGADTLSGGVKLRVGAGLGGTADRSFAGFGVAVRP